MMNPHSSATPAPPTTTRSPANPLLAAGSFSLSDSFGPQPALLVPSAAPPPAVTPPTTATPTPPSLSAVSSTSSLSSLTAPPTPGLFLLPNANTNAAGSGLGPAPPPTVPPASIGTNAYSLGGQNRRGRYVPPPGIHASGAAAAAAPPVAMLPSAPSSTLPPVSVPPLPSLLPAASSHPHTPAPATSPFMQESFSPPPPLPSSSSAAAAAQSRFGGGLDNAASLAYHWFYRVKVNQGGVNSSQYQWKPFSMVDSLNLEDAFQADPGSTEPVSTDGGRYDANLPDRVKTAVYYHVTRDAGEVAGGAAADDDDADTFSMPIRRCSWFHRSNTDGRWTPYDEETALRLENEFASASETGRWSRTVQLQDGEYVTLHSANVIMHFPSEANQNHKLDDWGQVQPQDPELKPRVVHRGLEGLPEIPDGEMADVDHLVFVVHGIGAVCDMKFRSIHQVVDGFRALTAELSEKHFQSAHLAGRANRIEFLPVNWHATLHGQDEGTDQRLKPLTLKSIPKLRSFVNDTLLDILFYTSPVYCQRIVDTVVSEVNRMYTLFMARNANFRGQVSVVGHSLGSLILFDVLSHQTEDADAAREEGGGPAEAEQEKPVTATVVQQQQSAAPTDDPNLTLEQLFAQLGLSEYTSVFTDEGIDIHTLSACTDDDLQEAGVPAEKGRQLLQFLVERKQRQQQQPGKGGGGSSGSSGDGLKALERSSVTSDVKYTVGPAGTGQPSIHYPRLCFQPTAFYALGAPIAMFLSVRGIQSLGRDFRLPTCPNFFNIFHPYDPVAYRLESLVDAEHAKLRPIIIPHHKGRKRMHLELKDTVTKLMTTDIKQKIYDSVSATINTVYNMATGTSGGRDESGGDPSLKQALEDSMSKQADEADEADAMNPRTLDSGLNRGKRIDYVLQEAPLESFNEYLFALASHLCYWESEDTCLMILKDIYTKMDILSDDAQMSMAAGPPPLAKNVPYFNTATNPPTLEQKQTYAPTPILAPPPIPIGGTMQGTSTLQTSSTPILAPPPTPMGASMKGPSTLQSTTATPTLAPPPTSIGASMKGPSTLQSTSTTPILAPPPTPVGGSMKGASILQTTTTTPILAPPPTSIGGTMKGPAALLTPSPQTPAVPTTASSFSPASLGPPPSIYPIISPVTNTTAVPPLSQTTPSTTSALLSDSFTPSLLPPSNQTCVSSAFDSSSQQNFTSPFSAMGPVATNATSTAAAAAAPPSGPPPLMMAPSSANSAPSSSGLGYPKPSSYPMGSIPTQTGPAAARVGMDPTAPVSGSPAGIGPPPMAGFYTPK